MRNTVMIYDIKAAKEISVRDFAYKMSDEGQSFVYSDIETLAQGLDDEWYLLDECGNYVHVDPTRFEVLIPEVVADGN